ncbi:MAG: YkvA family protein [Chloroflexia bacterium]
MQKLLENGRLAWRLINDPRVPAWLKVGLPLLVVLYILSPLDFIPDFIPGLGELDDLGLVMLGMSLMVRLAPQDIVEEHRRSLGYSDAGASSRSAQGDRSYRAPAGNVAGDPPEADKDVEQAPIDGEYRVIPPDSGGPYAG